MAFRLYTSGRSGAMQIKLVKCMHLSQDYQLLKLSYIWKCF